MKKMLLFHRAVIPTQTNVIEASPDMRHADSPEWYYMPKDQHEKTGPVGFQEVLGCL